VSLLLTSVFRPFGVDDAYGRKENKCELFHNQVTREQGIYSVRYNHRSFGLYFIAENLRMPTVVLDFPTLRQFRKELRKGYDYVGISFITPNFIKAKKMAEVVREVSPSTQIILGGHGTRIPDIEKLIDCDYVLPGEGISALRELFGEDIDAPIHHPVVKASEHKRVLGLPFGTGGAVLVPGVGCPNACAFCCTSHFFDKTYTPFLKTGEEIYETACRCGDALNSREFFVMDENFLKHKERAVELLKLLEKNKKKFSFSIFSSAEAITDFGVENMLKMGINYVWLGVESKRAIFEKTQGIDVKKLMTRLRQNGIMVLASSILFLDHHTKETIWEDIDFAIDLRPDFTQFMQLGPLPQTPVYLSYKAKGWLREEIPYEEWHGQHKIWFDHPHFTRDESEVYLRKAFQREFKTLGPSIVRIADTMLNGLESPLYQKDNPALRVQFERLRERCRIYFYALTGFKWLAMNRKMRKQTDDVIRRYEGYFGKRKLLHYLAGAGMALIGNLYRLKLKLGFEAHNPPRFRVSYRMMPRYEELCEKARTLLQNRRTWAILEPSTEGWALSLHFSGKINRKTVNALFKRLNDQVHRPIQSVRINVTALAEFSEETLTAFLERISHFCREIRIYCSELHQEKITQFLEKAQLNCAYSVVAV